MCPTFGVQFKRAETFSDDLNIPFKYSIQEIPTASPI